MSDRDGRVAGGAPRLWHGMLVAALISVSLIALALWFGGESRRAARNNDDLGTSLRRQIAIERLFSEIKDGETGQRGYIITGNRAFLEPYAAARASVQNKLDQLAPLLDGQAEDHRRLAHLRTVIKAKFAEMQRLIDVRSRYGLTPAAAGVAQGAGKSLMDEIRADVAALIDSNEVAMKRAFDHERARGELIQNFIWLSVLLLSLLAFAVAYFLWKERAQRHETARRETDLSSRQKAIFQHTQSPIILINPSGSMEVLNPAAERLFGYPSTGLLRRDISVIADIAPGEGPFLERVGLQGGLLIDPYRPLVQARRKDGATVPVEVVLGLMPLEDGMHIVASFRDMSEREKVERMKDQFLSTVSHELRTPLTSIVGSLGLLSGGAAEELTPAAQRLIVIAENNANRLIGIVNDLLDVEKLESGKMTFHFDPLDLRDTLRRSVDEMQGFARGKQVSLDLDLSGDALPVRADNDRLIQVVVNLISNAVRFSPQDGVVSIAASLVGGAVRVSISDQGPGIDPEVRGRLFTRFVQGSRPSDTANPGTGLGLTISREIVRNHGGSIWFEDAPGGGTSFVFDLPSWNALTGQEEMNGAPRLLLLTDAAEAEVIAANFAERAIRADAVATAEEAIATIAAREYLAMILDFQFIGEAAASTMGMIRAQPRGRTLPVIAIAGQSPPIEASDMASLDIIDWVTKPLAGGQLDTAIGAALDRAAVTMPLVLHIDDDSDTLEITSSALSGVARIAHATDLASARAFLREQMPDIMIVDLALPDGSGLEILSDMEPNSTRVPVIIYSAQDNWVGDMRDVEAILTKSRRSLPNLVETVLAILDRRKEGLEA